MIAKGFGMRRVLVQALRGAAAALLVGVALLASVTDAPARVLIGVTLGEHADAAAVIQRVRAGYPADAAGLRRGDLIIEVDGVPPAGAEAAARAITERSDGPTRLLIRRDGAAFEATILPWATPDPTRDAALFPYPEDPEALAGTALRARIAERDYEIVSPAAVFTLARSFNADSSMVGRRVAFRARVMNCDMLAGAPPTLYQPGSSPLYEFSPTQSLLFDPEAAAAEKARCDAYMDANGLKLSSPVVVIAGRFAVDENRVLSSGGPVLLVDAVLFDQNHVSLGSQVVGFVDVLERMASAF